MKQDFDPKSICDVETARRYVIETRVFNSGFNVKAMRPEVKRQIRMLDPNHKYKTMKKKLLEDTWAKNVEINRSINDSTFDKMLHDRKNWREYNYPPDHPKWLSTDVGVSRASSKNRKSRGTPRTQKESTETDVIDKVLMENQTQVEGADIGGKEKSIVIEKRLPRRSNDAFSMTMRTLGPVYFQSSVNQEATGEAAT